MPFTCLPCLTIVRAQTQANLEPCKLNATLLVQLERVGEPDNTGRAQSTVSYKMKETTTPQNLHC